MEADYGRALPEGAPALLPLEDVSHLDFGPEWDDRHEIAAALDRSLVWTRREHAEQFFPIAGITHERALRSLERLRELLLDSHGRAAFDAAVKGEFQVYISAGWDGRGGGVLFTGYCTPLLPGSLTPDETHRWPLYGLPPDLVKGQQGAILGWETAAGLLPYPSRAAIEAGALLEDRGLELVWLRDPVDAYIAHVNGSAFIDLPDGTLARFGYSGKNGRAYTSLGRELIDDGVVPAEGMNLAAIREWGRTTDEATVLEYLRRNESYVFFQPIDGNPHGSLDFPVESERSIATDKRLFPRGAACFVTAELPARLDTSRIEPYAKLCFDQDTGGAIRTAGRAGTRRGSSTTCSCVSSRLFLRE
jgi:membrane-bound lytic murein transglycosylase A